MDTSKIKVGTRLTILVPAGKGIDRATGRIVQEWKEATGRVVMPSSHGGWVLNMGGRYGTPGVADVRNIVKINGKRVSNKTAPGD
ncbi:MAG: hypothetical protein ACREGR_00235 [Minisyncoccia bacterium]